jgi:hypothetical protein
MEIEVHNPVCIITPELTVMTLLSLSNVTQDDSTWCCFNLQNLSSAPSSELEYYIDESVVVLIVLCCNMIDSPAA